MAKPSVELVAALRATAVRLRSGAPYAWTHVGACNCGHLAQTLTGLQAAEIRALAYEKPGSEWTEHAFDYCPQSGYRLDDVLTVLFEAGLERADIEALERLRDPEIIARMPMAGRDLSQRDRAHVVLYLEAWADLLESKLPPPRAEPVQVEPLEPDRLAA